MPSSVSGVVGCRRKWEDRCIDPATKSVILHKFPLRRRSTERDRLTLRLGLLHFASLSQCEEHRASDEIDQRGNRQLCVQIGECR